MTKCQKESSFPPENASPKVTKPAETIVDDISTEESVQEPSKPQGYLLPVEVEQSDPTEVPKDSEVVKEEESADDIVQDSRDVKEKVSRNSLSSCRDDNVEQQRRKIGPDKRALSYKEKEVTTRISPKPGSMDGQ